MATDLETRQTSSKSAAYLQRTFAHLCARMRRADLVSHLLALSLLVSCYAFLVGGFDALVGNATAIWVDAIRWIACGVFGLLFLLGFARTVRCLFRKVNPYYVAAQIELNQPDAKNSLINWLDLQNEDIPPAFHKTVSARAQHTMQAADAEQTLRTRKNRFLVGALGVPALGLLVLLALGPTALMSSLLHAFYPLYTPARVTSTEITLLHPETGDAEVSPILPFVFSARITGRVPTGSRPDAPMLRYRYQKDEDDRLLLLDQTNDGTWTAQMQPTEIRTGFSYRITAGDAETATHQVRVRAAAYVKFFEISYRHTQYRKLKDGKVVFPNERSANPLVHGPRGTEVAMFMRVSRPTKAATVEFVINKVKQALPLRPSPDDPQAFHAKWTLEQSGLFRIVFTTVDGEENSDRDWYPIQVPEDESPHVVLTQPGQDVALPENDTLELAGLATSEVGLKSLALHVRVIVGPKEPLAPIPYRPGKSFQLGDGSFPEEIDYRHVLPLDELILDKGTTKILLSAGNVIEVWLEAVDCTDTPTPTGRVGASPVKRVTIIKAIDSKQAQANRDKAAQRQQEHAKRQDKDHARKNDERKKEPNGATGQSHPQKDHDAAKNEKEDFENKLSQAKKEQDQQKQKGGAKPADQPNAEKKDGPQPGDGGAEPQAKKQPSISPDEAGNEKGQGGGDAGQPKDRGEKEKGKDGPPQGNAKGVEQNGPEPPNKGQQTALDPAPPGAKAKGGMMGDAAGAAKGDQQQEPAAGSTRGAEQKAGSEQPSLGAVAKLVEQLSDRNGKANDAAAALAGFGKTADDPRVRDIVQDILKQNGRDPKTGKEEKKGPNTFGSGGKTPGIFDDVKAAAVNRLFAAKLGQMQLDDWKKRLTPDLLKRAGMSDADWQRYVQSMQTYDALVRRLNAQQIRAADRKTLLGKGGALPGAGPSLIENKGASNTPLEGGSALPPPELLDAQRRFSERPLNP